MERLNLIFVHDYDDCTATMTKMITNIISNPGEAKYRRIRTDNPKFASRVYSQKGAPEFFQHVGFKKHVEEGFIVLPEGADLALLQRGVDALAAQKAARAAEETRKRKAIQVKAKEGQERRDEAAGDAANAGKFDAAVRCVVLTPRLTQRYFGFLGLPVSASRHP